MPVRCVEMGAVLPTHSAPLDEPEVAVHLGSPRVPRLAAAPLLAVQKAAHDATAHLVTGGTGGLGLLTARWLAQGGAHALALASRSGAVARNTATEWAQLLTTDAGTLVQRCDAAETAHV